MAHFMHRILQLPIRAVKKKSLIRNLSLSKCLQENYEGDGKTTVTILNREHKHLIMFDAFSDKGFRLNNGIFVVGPVAVFPRTILQWNVATMESLTPECFSLFHVLEPRLDIFVLGTGNIRIQPKEEVLSFFKKNKISVELLPTQQACSTFNFLNAEGRCVAGAFLPVNELKLYDDELKLLNETASISPFTEKL